MSKETAVPKKEFIQWITEDALPATEDILSELKAINKQRDDAKQYLKENNIEITEHSIQQHIHPNL